MSQQPQPKMAYSIPEAAQVSDMGRSTLYVAIKSGKLRSVKAGRRRLILPEDLLAWLKSNRDGANGSEG